MSNAYFNEGLVIEWHAENRCLTIDGEPLAVPNSMVALGEAALVEHAKTQIQQSAIAARRNAIRDEHLAIFKCGVKAWAYWRRNHPEVRPLLFDADLRGFQRPGVNLANANLIGANLVGANLTDANFHEANLAGADLSDAILSRANFCRTDLYETILRNATLDGANLQGTQLAKTKFMKANLTGCRVYGLSAWDLEGLEQANQKDLAVHYETEKTNRSLLVDDLRFAQLIYSMLHNANLSGAIDSVARKAVLILGQFAERMHVLLAIRDHLRRAQQYVPILFDFAGPLTRNLGETISILAALSRFVIADLTRPRSSSLELHAIAPNFMIPVVPIIEAGEQAFALFEGLQDMYWWVAPVVEYPNVDALRHNLDRYVIARALDLEAQIEARRHRPRPRSYIPG